MEFTLEEQLLIVTQRAEKLHMNVVKTRNELLNFEPGVITYGKMGSMKIEEYDDMCRHYVDMIDELVTYESFIKDTKDKLEPYENY